MAISQIPLRIAQISDVHFGGALSLPAETMESVAEGIRAMEPDDIKIVAVHHHLISVPGTGRERNIVHDAGDLLLTLTRMDVDLILSGHKHVPFFWGLNGMLLCSSGTAGTRRLRGRTPPSWNELHVDATTVKVFLNYLDGRRELAVIFNRKTRALTREAFYITEDFLHGNQVLAV